MTGTETVTEPPRPKSPPTYPDFCGKHRLLVEVHSLNREIGFLEEELRSLDGARPVLQCCKEVGDFVGSNPDPLVPCPSDHRKHKSCRMWKWIRKNLCLNFSWICCSSKCSLKFRKPSCSCNPFRRCCCTCNPTCCFQCHCTHCCCSDISSMCCCCDIFKCFRCHCSQCCCWNFFTLSCFRSCCACSQCSCPKCSCGCVFSCPDCTDACLCLCPKCTRPCCVSRCLCP